MDTVSESIELFYAENPSFHNIPLEEFKLICNSPFKFVKEVLNRGILRDIRLQYFGIFEVSPSRVKYYKKQLEENYNNRIISEKKYNEKMKILKSYESKN